MVNLPIHMDSCWSCPACRPPRESRRKNRARGSTDDHTSPKRGCLLNNNNSWSSDHGLSPSNAKEDPTTSTNCLEKSPSSGSEEVSGINGLAVSLSCTNCGQLKVSPSPKMCLRCQIHTPPGGGNPNGHKLHIPKNHKSVLHENGSASDSLSSSERYLSPPPDLCSPCDDLSLGSLSSDHCPGSPFGQVRRQFVQAHAYQFQSYAPCKQINK